MWRDCILVSGSSLLEVLIVRRMHTRTRARTHTRARARTTLAEKNRNNRDIHTTALPRFVHRVWAL